MNILHLAQALDAVPFLPHGKGALILIFGGLAVLPASLLWSTVSSRAQWATGIEPGIARAGLGPCRIVSANVQLCIVTLTACQGCHGSARRGGSCESQRRMLLELAHQRAPNASVKEISCGTLGAGTCTFMIERGRSA